jgi:hypothetical protein
VESKGFMSMKNSMMLFYTSETTSAVMCQDNSTIVIFFIRVNNTAEKKLQFYLLFVFGSGYFIFFRKY